MTALARAFHRPGYPPYKDVTMRDYPSLDAAVHVDPVSHPAANPRLVTVPAAADGPRQATDAPRVVAHTECERR